jgi:adhesin/invasin
MTAHRAVRLATVLLAMALTMNCREVDNQGSVGDPVGPGTGDEEGSIVAVPQDATLRGNGVSKTTVTASVYDSEGDPVGAGVTVSFSATRGTIEGSALTDGNGQAQALYTSGVGSGFARINVSTPNATGSTEVLLTAGDPNQIVVVEVQRHSVGVSGSDLPQTSLITFQVLDNEGVPVGSTPDPVTFDLVALTSGGGESLEPTSDLPDENGIVRTALRGGTVPGVTEIVATLITTSPADTIVSSAVRISINTSLPFPNHLTVASKEINVPGCLANVRNEVIAIAFDEFHNPVVGGTSVYFTTRYCGIQPADTTDDHGVANVNFITGNPFPPNAPPGGPYGYPYGFTYVLAQTADAGGNQIVDSTLVLVSRCTLVEAAPLTFSIPDGGCQNFSFNVWDLNHNPLSSGTNITVTPTAGSVAGDLDVTLPDVQAGYTDFAFSLCDDDPGDVDPPTSVSVTIQVTSRNGDATVTILGTIN